MEREMKDVGITLARKLKTGMCGGCLSVAYTLTGVRGNDDDDFFLKFITDIFYVIRPIEYFKYNDK